MSLNQMDRYYRAALQFAKELSDANLPADDVEKKLRDLFARNGAETERLASVYYDVSIEKDWIERIEGALPHLEAAIREDRQFIKTEGNITPIERVRKVSRTSVEHLSRHSEMITHVPEAGEDLIPDKLKVFENESNYAIYENRVLYMVLCFTRDFVDYRYYKISQARKECNSELEFRKNILTGDGPIRMELRYSDMTHGLNTEGSSEILSRLEATTAAVGVLLSMPLMKNVAQAPMVQAPITRTNVLRMDKHFKEVVALFDYLSAYKEDGFKLERHEKVLSPFPPKLHESAVEMTMYTHYLYNLYAHGLTETLDERYALEEERRMAEVRRKREERLKAIFSGKNAGEISQAEFLELLSEAVTIGEEKEQQIQALQDEMELIQGEKEAEKRRYDTLKEDAERGWSDAESLRRQLSDTKKETISLTEEMQAKLDKAQEDLTAEQERCRLLEARIIGMLEEYGVKKPEADMTEREEFLELEKEKAAFDRFFERSWGTAKRKIRKRILWKRR
ncbi:MAG: hypothetical protein IKX10_08385 [Lachnospiraceae bacterium]|nr:hypothetical protein [Lachnospiraceae bacterium]